MQNFRMFLIIFFYAILTSSSIYAQHKYKVGIIVALEDTYISHFISGSSITYAKDYLLPFDFSESYFNIAQDILKEKHKNVEFIRLPDSLVHKFRKEKIARFRNQFKTYGNKWIEKTFKEYDIDAFLVISNTNRPRMYYPDEAYNGSENFQFITERNSYCTINFKLMFSMIWDFKEHKTRVRNFTVGREKIPELTYRGKEFTNEQLKSLKTPLEEFVKKHLEKYSTHKDFEKMKASVRYKRAIENLNNQER